LMSDIWLEQWNGMEVAFMDAKAIMTSPLEMREPTCPAILFFSCPFFFCGDVLCCLDLV
jgi:hypothetical protein